jgi:hypothetical protein
VHQCGSVLVSSSGSVLVSSSMLQTVVSKGIVNLSRMPNFETVLAHKLGLCKEFEVRRGVDPEIVHQGCTLLCKPKPA